MKVYAQLNRTSGRRWWNAVWIFGLTMVITTFVGSLPLLGAFIDNPRFGAFVGGGIEMFGGRIWLAHHAANRYLIAVLFGLPIFSRLGLLIYCVGRRYSDGEIYLYPKETNTPYGAWKKQ